MSTRYVPLLEAVKAQLQAINPARLVTRNWADFDQRTEAELLAGVWIVRPATVGPYPYETSDNGGATDSLRATQHGRLRITIVGQRVLPIGCAGTDIDAAEFELLHELETLADAAMEIAGLEALQLRDVQLSQQIEAPYAWVHSTWDVFAF